MRKEERAREYTKKGEKMEEKDRAKEEKDRVNQSNLHCKISTNADTLQNIQ